MSELYELMIFSHREKVLKRLSTVEWRNTRALYHGNHFTRHALHDVLSELLKEGLIEYRAVPGKRGVVWRRRS